MSNKPSTIIFERDGSVVRIEFVCNDEYEAIKLYDEVTIMAKNGLIQMRLAIGECIERDGEKT